MPRIVDHPILGPQGESPEITVFVDGKPVRGRQGEPLAVLLLASGMLFLRRTAKGSPRSTFCGIGQCTDCSMTVNGVSNVRTCITPAVDGMIIETETETEGAG